jgi:glycosyltransferase involved in cell wall biosynthesis
MSGRLKVAILHHHLRGGGVTRVIKRTLESLENKEVDLCVICGEEFNADEFDEMTTGIVDGLSYGEDNSKVPADLLLGDVKGKAAEMLGNTPDIWHVHNHTLGKNAAYSQVAVRLGEEGHHVLYHLHDFAEDNRPSNYKYLTDSLDHDGLPVMTKLYPKGDHVQYGLLNGRDQQILKDSGLSDKDSVLLSNPVTLDSDGAEKKKQSVSQKGKLYLYPVRVIPRKNIGELALWSALAEEDEQFGVTLAPKNTRYKQFYSDWVEFSKERKLPLTFEAGKEWGMSFPELLENAQSMITTSIAEGFGLVFLESWLIGKPLAGRLLPEIVSDFREAGIEFPGMYEALKIPLNWFDKEELRNSLSEGICKLLDSYGKSTEVDKVNVWLDSMIVNEEIDFCRLNSSQQQSVIDFIIQDESCKMSFERITKEEISEDLIQSNKKIIEEKYSLEGYGEKLMKVYSDLAGREPSKLEYLDPERILDQFISPEHFSLLRS